VVGVVAIIVNVVVVVVVVVGSTGGQRVGVRLILVLIFVNVVSRMGIGHDGRPTFGTMNGMKENDFEGRRQTLDLPLYSLKEAHN